MLNWLGGCIAIAWLAVGGLLILTTIVFMALAGWFPASIILGLLAWGFLTYHTHTRR